MSLERFTELLKGWGFVASEDQIRELFNWVDFDKDGGISFEDIKETVGLDVAPREAVYFR